MINKIQTKLYYLTLSIFIVLIDQFELTSYSFILGGTIGNGLDRILKGFVIDFINLNIINFPVFNIADISINIGFFFLIYNIFKNNR